MSSDERTRRGLAVQRRLQENGMKSIMKRGKVADHAAVVRQFRDGEGEGPAMVAVRFPGKSSPTVIISEKMLGDLAERYGGNEEDAALHLATELHAPGVVPGVVPHGLHVGGTLHMSGPGREAIRQAFEAAGVPNVDPELIGEAINELYGGSDEDNAVMLGSKGMYAVAEHQHGAGGRSVLSALGEGLRGSAGKRLPLNITRTLVVRPTLEDGTPEPDEDSEIEDSALEKVARRFSPARRKGES